ncbi:Yippee/Mis18, partial [Cladochytrium replicatum]
RIFVCLGCSTHLASQDDIVSKAFQGRHGRAYLFKNVVNVVVGPSQERVLITGLHTVADVHCSVCQNTLGWKYLHAFEESQKYKEGCYIIE